MLGGLTGGPAGPAVAIVCDAVWKKKVCQKPEPPQPDEILLPNIFKGGIILNGTNYVLKTENTNEPFQTEILLSRLSTPHFTIKHL